MDFFLAHLRETLEAINKLIDNNIYRVDTKRIRRCNHIRSSDRSKINFIWRSLEYLNVEGILEINGSYHPKTYNIKTNQKLNVDEIMFNIEKKRTFP
ncbi:MAG: hypothetical protein ACTSV5_10465 [Promethearchaeota archaeon]